MSAAFFGAFQPRHLQITRGGWRFPSSTNHSPLSSPLASKNRRCSMHLVTLDAQFEAETEAKLARVQVMLRKRVAGLLNDRHSFVYSIATASPIKGPTLSVCALLAEGWVDLCVREEAHSLGVSANGTKRTCCPVDSECPL